MVFDSESMPVLDSQNRWLLTGVAGFIGSNILEELLRQNQIVVGIDNFSTGFRANLDSVKEAVGEKKWKNFTLYEMDIVEDEKLKNVTAGADFVLHQAALGSVPRSIKDPLNTHRSNVTGFLSVLDAARFNNVKKIVFASSSSVYGDNPNLPKQENSIGNPLSPYAGTKLIDEIYADIFSRTYQLPFIGLRYFNVFGKRQSPFGEYAAVIPKWINAAILGQEITIHGDGETSRDFCYIKNAVQANLLAAISKQDADNHFYNVAYGERNTLKTLHATIIKALDQQKIAVKKSSLTYGPFRSGDIRHSLADISKAREKIGYRPQFDLGSGIDQSISWYIKNALPAGQTKS
jgi:UDP-N-acetylglucosamine 4-epimerase